ncbi:hypothetical protein ACOSQ2_022056 [Xanthoceras sorbifolium]
MPCVANLVRHEMSISDLCPLDFKYKESTFHSLWGCRSLDKIKFSCRNKWVKCNVKLPSEGVRIGQRLSLMNFLLFSRCLELVLHLGLQPTDYSKKVGLGYIIRNDQGMVMAAISCKVAVGISVDNAEALAILSGLQLA